MANQYMPREEREYLRYLRDVHRKSQENRCYFCDVEMTDPVTGRTPPPSTMVTIEHLKSVGHGGGSNFLNTAAACLGCNARRGRERGLTRGKKTIPRVRFSPNRPEPKYTGPVIWTYGYTIPSDPFVLRLINSEKDKDAIVEELRDMEQSPVTLKSVEILKGKEKKVA